MPWKLGDPDEPTEVIQLRLPKSLKDWLSAQPGGMSAFIRRLVERAKKRSEREKSGLVL
jgi:hypothetical protein